MHVDNHPEGVKLPNGGVTSIRSNARFILVVENLAMFDQIIHSKFFKKFDPCIVFTADRWSDMMSDEIPHKLLN